MLGLHCFTEQKCFIHSLLRVLVEIHTVRWSQSLPSKMKDTVVVFWVKGGPSLHSVNICEAPVGTVTGTGANRSEQSITKPRSLCSVWKF